MVRWQRERRAVCVCVCVCVLVCCSADRGPDVRGGEEGGVGREGTAAGGEEGPATKRMEGKTNTGSGTREGGGGRRVNQG